MIFNMKESGKLVPVLHENEGCLKVEQNTCHVMLLLTAEKERCCCLIVFFGFCVGTVGGAENCWQNEMECSMMEQSERGMKNNLRNVSEIYFPSYQVHLFTCQKSTCCQHITKNKNEKGI